MVGPSCGTRTPGPYSASAQSHPSGAFESLARASFFAPRRGLCAAGRAGTLSPLVRLLSRWAAPRRRPKVAFRPLRLPLRSIRGPTVRQEVTSAPATHGSPVRRCSPHCAALSTSTLQVTRARRWWRAEVRRSHARQRLTGLDTPRRRRLARMPVVAARHQVYGGSSRALVSTFFVYLRRSAHPTPSRSRRSRARLSSTPPWSAPLSLGTSLGRRPRSPKGPT